jgi:hypothetical protein
MFLWNLDIHTPTLKMDTVYHSERSVSPYLNPVDGDRMFLWNINILHTSTLKLQAVCTLYKTTQCHTSEDHNLKNYRREKIETYSRCLVTTSSYCSSLQLLKTLYYWGKMTVKVNFPNVHTKRTETIDLVFLFNVRQTVFWWWITSRKDLLDHCQG